MKKLITVLILVLTATLCFTQMNAYAQEEEFSIIGLENIQHEFEAGANPNPDIFVEGLAIYTNGAVLVREALLVDLQGVDFDRIGEYEVIYYFLYVDQNNEEKRFEIDRLLVTIKDTTKPQFSGVKNIEAVQNQTAPINYTQGVTASDNDKGSPLDIKVLSQAVDLTTPGVYPVTYFVADRSGNSATSKAYVLVHPETANPYAPWIEVEGNSITINVNEQNPDAIYREKVKAYDGDLDISENLVCDASGVKIDEIGTYYVVFAVSDIDGNIATLKVSVNVVIDDTPPVFLNLPDILNVTIFSTDARKGIKAYDEVSGDVSSRITIEGAIDYTQEGEYDVVFKVTDLNGNMTTKNVTVNILDNVPPTIDAPDNIYLKVNGRLNLADRIRVTDNVDTNVAYTLHDNELDATKVGTYLIRVSAVDQKGNVAERIITVYVYSTEPDNLLENPIVMGSIVAVGVSCLSTLISYIIMKRRLRKYRRHL